MMMAGPYAGTLSDLPTVRDEVTCSINAENPTGAKGFGCRETGPLGPSRKGKPCLNDIAPGQSVTLADIEGPVVFGTCGLPLRIAPVTLIDTFCAMRCLPSIGMMKSDLLWNVP